VLNGRPPGQYEHEGLRILPQNPVGPRRGRGSAIKESVTLEGVSDGEPVAISSRSRGIEDNLGALDVTFGDAQLARLSRASAIERA
jgi:hypothetical protein